MTKQIDIKQLIPYLDKGYVIMDSAERWFWEKYKPTFTSYGWRANNNEYNEEVCLSDCFNIKPVENWTESFIKVSGNESQNNLCTTDE